MLKYQVELLGLMDSVARNDAIEAIADIAKKVGSEIETNDIEVIVEMVEEAEKNTKEEAATESFTSHDSEVIADKVKDSISGHLLLVKILLAPCQITGNIVSWNWNIWYWNIQEFTERLPTLF